MLTSSRVELGSRYVKYTQTHIGSNRVRHILDPHQVKSSQAPTWVKLFQPYL